MIQGASGRGSLPSGAGWPGIGLGIVAAFGLFAGCLREPAVDLSAPGRDYKATEYEKVLKRWTRHRRIIKHFDTNLDVFVTYISQEMAAAHATVHARDYRLTRGERQRFLAKRLAEVQARHEFFLAATTADPAWNDFDRKESIWRLTLEDDRGTRVTPLVVKHLTMTEVHKVYFSYVTVFHRIYHVLFPRQVGGRPYITPDSRWFKLIIASPLGDTELAWFVQRGPKGRSGPGLPRPEPEGAERPASAPAPAPAPTHAPIHTPTREPAAPPAADPARDTTPRSETPPASDDAPPRR